MAALDTDKLITPTGVVAGGEQTMQTVDVTVTVAGAVTAAGAVTGSEFVTAGTLKQAAKMQMFSASKVLSDGVSTAFAEVAVGVGELIGGNIRYCIHVIDGTDFQAHTGGIGFVAVNKAGTITCDIKETYLPATAVKIVTSGTLTDTVSCTAGAGKVALAMNANTNLAGATLTLHYTMEIHTMNVITGL